MAPLTSRPKTGSPLTEWPRAAPHLQRALEYGLAHYPSVPDAYLKLAEIRTGLDQGRYTILVGERSALLVEVTKIGKKRFLGIVLAGGVFAEVATTLRMKAEAIAKRQRCHAIVIGGRKGWARALAPYGYRLEGPIQDSGAWLILKRLRQDRPC